MKLFAKKSKSKPALYNAYKKTQNVVIEKEKMLPTVPKQQERETPKIAYHSNHTQMTIAIVSLYHGTGCSHIASGIANYLDTQSDTDYVGLMKKGREPDQSSLNEHVTGIKLLAESKWKEDYYEDYSFWILDLGVIEELDPDELLLVKKANLKILVCSYGENQMQELWNFIKNQGSTERWRFVFNRLTKKIENKVYELMEDYKTYCLPVFDQTNIKEVKKVFKEIL